MEIRISPQTSGMGNFEEMISGFSSTLQIHCTDVYQLTNGYVFHGLSKVKLFPEK